MSSMTSSFSFSLRLVFNTLIFLVASFRVSLHSVLEKALFSGEPMCDCTVFTVLDLCCGMCLLVILLTFFTAFLATIVFLAIFLLVFLLGFFDILEVIVILLIPTVIVSIERYHYLTLNSVFHNNQLVDIQY